MGMQDRDWWRDAQRERERRETRETRSVASTARRGALGMLAFWLVVMAVLYAAFGQIDKRRQAKLAPYVLISGELVIPRGDDGHFHVSGTVNGHPVQFLVDTGASLVTVSEGFARQAGLKGGESVTFRTANGALQGRVLRSVPVAAGSMSLGDVSVAVGLVDHDHSMALLGQSFLSRFNVELNQREMILRARL